MTAPTNEEYGQKRHHHSSLLGTTFNLVNATIGAGIVGVPYTMQQCGLVAGVIMVFICALITDKTLKMLISTAKLVKVSSYEALSETCFGRTGFIFISFGMFIVSYGAMTSYLIISRDTLPDLLGVADDNDAAKRFILMVSSFCVVFPLSAQRDMADLAKTSTINVIFDCILVIIMVTTSYNFFNDPDSIINETYNDTPQTAMEVYIPSTFRPKTFFVGLGVLSFLFVIQHSGFIIANSLENPTNRRWSQVTRYAMTTCAIFQLVMGYSGYLAFRESTDGDILNNFSMDQEGWKADVAKAVICTTTFFVYPMECFVARHVLCMVLWNKDGSEVSNAKRIGVTFFLYLITLIPALAVRELGVVYSISGSIGGSCMAYIAPGLLYLGVHGDEFLKMTRNWWYSGGADEDGDEYDDRVIDLEMSVCKRLLWYLCLMPIWCHIANKGMQRDEETKNGGASPSSTEAMIEMNTILQPDDEDNDDGATFDDEDYLEYGVSEGQVRKQNGIVETEGQTKHHTRPAEKDEDEDGILAVEDEIYCSPTMYEFTLSISFILFGIFSAFAGIVSIAEE